MKKIYELLTVLGLFLFGGIVPATAQNEVTIKLCSTTGDWGKWNNNPNSPWASTWLTTATEPQLTLAHVKGNNNMNYWDGTNIKCYNSVGGSTQNEDYSITVSAGWYITSVSFDFFSDNANGIAVNLADQGAVECFSTDAADAEHVEYTNDDGSVQKVIFNVATLGSGTNFARTLNFIVKVKLQDNITKAWADFTSTFDKYTAMSADNFPVGTEPGCYDEAAVTAFFNAVEEAAAIDNEDPETITAEMLNAATKKMNDAYDAMIASKVIYQVANGYYRFRTGMQYSDGNPKYLMSYTLDQSNNAYWGTPGDAEDALAAIWKITKSGEFYDVLSVMSNGRFATVATSAAATLSAESTNLLAIEAAGTDGTDVFVNIRLSTAASGAAFYIHQNGHDGGNNSSGNIVGWYSTFSNGNPAASEWVLEPVDESEVQQLKSDYQTWKVHQELVAQYNPLFTTATAELAKSQDGVEGAALITDAEQFYSEWSDTDEGQDFGALIDDDPTTYWHSDWHPGSVPNHTHWLQVDLSQAEYSLVRMTITRRAVVNDHITRWSVFGSDDPEADEASWTEVATLFTPYGNNKETLSGLVFDGKGFKHLRFYIDGTTMNRGYGHVSEFQLYKVESLNGSAFAAAGAAATTLESTILAQKDITSADLTQANYNTLKSAYDAFHAKFSDPTEMRNLIKQAEEFAAGIVTGDNPGQWSDDSSVNALNGTIVAAKQYDETGNYDPAKTADFVSTLTAQMETIKAAANPVKTDTWYRIRFGTQEEFIEGEWDLVAGDGTDTDAELWGKYVTVGQFDGSSVEPIDITDVRMGTRLFFLDASDISDEDMSLFRFVESGDKGYLLQNKATGLFLKAAGTSGSVTLSIIPSFFSASALGYGQNLIAAKDLAGNAQNYLHAQVSQNTLVTWNATNVGSRSGLYIEEVGSAAGFDDTEFAMDIKPGQFYAFCYPTDLTTSEGKMLSVSSVANKTVELTTITSAAAGQPFLYLFETVEDYNADNSDEAVAFRHGYEFATEPQEAGVLTGVFAQKTLGAGYIKAVENRLEVTDGMGAVKAYEAYITSPVTVTKADNITVVIDGDKVIDGVHDLGATLNIVYRKGDIFTLDGRRVSSNGNIDDLRRYGRGVYIINGVKVAVK